MWLYLLKNQLKNKDRIKSKTQIHVLKIHVSEAYSLLKNPLHLNFVGERRVLGYSLTRTKWFFKWVSESVTVSVFFSSSYLFPLPSLHSDNSDIYNIARLLYFCCIREVPVRLKSYRSWFRSIRCGEKRMKNKQKNHFLQLPVRKGHQL